MSNSDLIISQIRQRLEILYQMVDELESGGGGDITVDQTYTPTSENAQSGKAVAEALETVPSVTVDQTYDATSTNAQSGVAIAGVVGDINSVLEEVL